MNMSLKSFEKLKLFSDISNVNINAEINVESLYNSTELFLNNTHNSAALLLILFTKVSMIPILDNLESQHSSFVSNIDEETKNEVQLLNDKLLNIQQMIQLYCSQMYLLNTFSNNLFKELIDNIPELNNINMNFLSFKNIQRGGNSNINITNNLNLLIKFFILLLLIFPVVSLNNNDNRFNRLNMFKTSGDNNNLYNVDALTSIDDTNDIIDSLINTINQQKSIDVSRIIDKYNTEFKQNYDGVFGSLIMHLTNIEPSSGENIINNIVNETNNKLLEISNNLTNNCKTIMKRAYDNEIFSSWKTLDDYETTRNKLKSAESLTYGFDFRSALSFFNIGNKLLSVMNLNNDKPELLTENEKNDLYKYSKLYCTFGYNLQLAYDNNKKTINVVGGKLDYDLIINLIDTLKLNLDSKMNEFKNDNSESKQLALKILTSTSQKLDIMKAITHALSDIISFDAYYRITNIMQSSSSKMIENIKKYFDDEIKNLNDLSGLLNMQLPSEHAELKIKEDIEREARELEIIKNNILDLNQNTTNMINVYQSERHLASLKNSWSIINTYFNGWLGVGSNFIKLIGHGTSTILGNITQETTNALLTVPENFINSNLQFFNKILWNFVINPGGWFILSVPLFIFLGNFMGILRIFTLSGRKFLVITYRSIAYFFEIIYRGTGHIFLKRTNLKIDYNKIDNKIDNKIEVEESKKSKNNNFKNLLLVSENAYNEQSALDGLLSLNNINDFDDKQFLDSISNFKLDISNKKGGINIKYKKTLKKNKKLKKIKHKKTIKKKSKKIIKKNKNNKKTSKLFIRKKN